MLRLGDERIETFRAPGTCTRHRAVEVKAFDAARCAADDAVEVGANAVGVVDRVARSARGELLPAARDGVPCASAALAEVASRAAVAIKVERVDLR